MNIDSSSVRSTMPRSAGCQPATARSCASRRIRGVSAVHSRPGGIGVSGGTVQLTMM